ncbi:hypothetical protein LY76DRAFT_119890 [Colletotrichum caudatum]|nr:hypothetical protein LY76DRAFT_119890 [Colletotrichum caudatum]
MRHVKRRFAHLGGPCRACFIAVSRLEAPYSVGRHDGPGGRLSASGRSEGCHGYISWGEFSNRAICRDMPLAARRDLSVTLVHACKRSLCLTGQTIYHATCRKIVAMVVQGPGSSMNTRWPGPRVLNVFKGAVVCRIRVGIPDTRVGRLGSRLKLKFPNYNLNWQKKHQGIEPMGNRPRASPAQNRWGPA